jgi:hypothetical protein
MIPRGSEDLADDVVTEFQGKIVSLVPQLNFRVLRILHSGIVKMLEGDRKQCGELLRRRPGLVYNTEMGAFVDTLTDAAAQKDQP